MVSFCAEGRLLLMVAFCAVVQVICAFVTLCLTVYVVLRDTRHMNEQDERQEMAEKLASHLQLLHGSKGILLVRLLL